MNSKVKQEINSLNIKLSKYKRINLISSILEDVANIKNIKNFCISLGNKRRILKQNIFKYERNLSELDKEYLEGVNNRQLNNNIRKILFELNKINEIIKKSLKNIILEIK